MFELIGLFSLRVYGYGWLWGREQLPSAYDAFGNGGHLLEVGIISIIVHVAALVACQNFVG